MFTSGGVVSSTPGFTSAGIVISSAPGTTTENEYGEVWCSYSVTFTGPTVSNAAVPLFATSEISGGIWNTTPGFNYNDAFIVDGRGTPDLDIKPLSMGEYMFQFVSNAWNSATTKAVGDTIVSALEAVGNTATILTDPNDLEGIVQVLLNAANYPPPGFVLPALLGGSNYALTGYRMPGGSQRT
jgi:hypothetical protein